MVTKFMGLLLFLVGFILIVLAVLVLVEILQVPGIDFFQRILMFLGGLILCVIGYVMARDQTSTA
jgi:hypothetical protein